MAIELLNGRYKIERSLKEGGGGKAYLALDLGTPVRSQCFIKCLKDVNSNNPSIEAEILELLGIHDQIPTKLDFFEENQFFYIVQEFIEGESLDTMLNPSYRWSNSQAVHLLRSVLAILEFVHDHGFIHCDIKPSNLIQRTNDGQLILVDFGSAKRIQNELTDTPTVFVGTPGYMPSEQAQVLRDNQSDRN